MVQCRVFLVAGAIAICAGFAAAQQQDITRPDNSTFDTEFSATSALGYSSNPLGQSVSSGSAFLTNTFQARYSYANDIIALRGSLTVSDTRFFEESTANSRRIDTSHSLRFRHTQNLQSAFRVDAFFREAFQESREEAVGAPRISNEALLSRDLNVQYGLFLENDVIAASAIVGARRFSFNDLVFADGTESIRTDQNRVRRSLTLELRHTADTDFQPFLRALFQTAEYDDDLDENGNFRDRNTRAVSLGAVFQLGDQISGDLAVGYRTETFDDELLPNLGFPTLDAQIEWQANDRTALFAEVGTSFAISTFPDESGASVYDVLVGIERDLSDSTVLSLTAEASLSRFANFDAQDFVERSATLGVRLEHSFRGNSTLFATLEHERFDATGVELDFEETTASFGVQVTF